MAEPGTVEKLVAEIGRALLPLRDALRSPADFSTFVQELGWTTTELPGALRDLGSRVDGLYDSLVNLIGAGGFVPGGSSEPGDTPAASAADVARALSSLTGVIESIRAVSSAPDSAIPESLRVDGFAAKFPGQLIEFLVVTYLLRFHPAIGFGLSTLGVIKTRYVPAEGHRPPYMHMSLDPADLPRTLSDPAQVLRNAFGWGTADFDYPAMASEVDNLLSSLGMAVFIDEVPRSTVAAVQGDPQSPDTFPVRAVRALLLGQITATGRTAAELRLMPLPGRDALAPGLALLPSLEGDLVSKLPLGPGLLLTIKSSLDLQGGVALQVRPGQPIEIVTGFESSDTPVHAKGSVEVALERSDPDGEPKVIIGSPGGTRLQYRKVGGGGGLRLSGNGDADVYAEFELQGLEFVFEPSGADGFIGKLLPSAGFDFKTDLTVGFSSVQGFYFKGTSNLEIQVPAHLKLGPVEIDGLTISASPSDGKLPIGLGTTIKADLGPFKAVIEQIGMSATFEFRSGNDGNLGPLDLSIGFKPPKGVGLSIDIGVVSGGGYLSFDSEKGEYAGALELKFAGFLELKAIGLISTRMPDGSDGFSLLIVITAEFPGGLQLGFGFTLLAVGGLIGLNRRMDLDALAKGVQSGAIESVMFPQDVVANAPRIISDLRTFFPAEDGKFLIGPMAKIGWGTPTLISVSLGVIIEIPGNIAIVGVLRCILPTKELALVVIQVNFIGAIEFDKDRLWFYAVLFDSRILTMTIEGGMGLLIGWGDDAELVLSVGGFHPSFKPPPLPFPAIPRLAVDIINKPGYRIRVEGYFAITSNTVQFGARAELQLGFSDFGISGHLSFDALFRFSPFAFMIAISASVSLKAFGVGLFGIDLDFALEGPAPWRAHGRGSISLLFFEISADFDFSWGEDNDTTLPPVAVLPILKAEFSKVEGWETRLPTGGTNPLVTLRALAATDTLVLHPLGTLFVRQRAIPLDIGVDRLGAQKPNDGKRFSAQPALGSGFQRLSITGDKFAMAQFQTMDDAAKLSRPAYEDQNAGLELAAAEGAMTTAKVVARRSARYELIITDNTPLETAPGLRRMTAAAASPGIRRRFQNISPVLFNQFLAGSSTSRSAMSQRQAEQKQPYGGADTVQVSDKKFVVAYVRNNLQAFPPSSQESAGTFRSQSAAAEALARWVADEPSLDGTLHVVPEDEAGAPLAIPGAWAPVGLLPAGASGAAAVRLNGGKVLTAGGEDGTGKALAGTALFDAVANTWEALTALPTSRHLHTMSRLDGGKVLLVGGTSDPVGGLDTCELYDPLAKTWKTQPKKLKAGRFAHSATVLPDGRVLVAGGKGTRGGRADSLLSSVEIFNPADGTWSEAEPMIDARAGHQAVLLDQTKVLVIGGAVPTGTGTEVPSSYCELYDVTTGIWTAAEGMTAPRSGHQVTALDAKRVLVTGGDATSYLVDGTYDPHSRGSAEVFELGGSWKQVAALPSGRSRHQAVLLRTGKVLVLGGTSGPGFTAGFQGALLYDPAADTWTETGGLSVGRWGHVVVELTDGRILTVGGTALSGTASPQPGTGVLTATAEVYLP
ncbi:hypothetical protein OG474_30730 [Kribbella sp. NBC_01505]|uniref:DUF6603 domain-containing protein n=1 Tax=Kribbella sp. NBC_01505 TaxID=2903580 RepID=UPI00386D0F64